MYVHLQSARLYRVQTHRQKLLQQDSLLLQHLLLLQVLQPEMLLEAPELSLLLPTQLIRLLQVKALLQV